MKGFLPLRLASVVLLSLSLCRATEPGDGEIVIKEGTLLEKNHTLKRAEWMVKQLLQPAIKVWRGKPWAADAERLCRRGLKAFNDGASSDTFLGDLAGDARKLMAAGCDDALACFVCQLCLVAEHGDWREGMTALARSKGNGNSATRLAAIDCLRAHQEIMWLKKKTRVDYRDHEAQLAQLVRAVDDGSYAPEFEAVFLRDQLEMLKAIDKIREDRFQAILVAWQKSKWPDWVKFTLVGRAEIEWAWKLRGGGWASTVTDAGAQGFIKHIEDARKVLEKAWELRPDRPEAATLMITVSMGTGSPIQVTRQWFDRAVAAQFDYAPAYVSMTYAYRPRWGGSREQMLEFGKACAATKRYDTTVPGVIYDACEGLGVESANPNEVFSNPIVRESVIDVAKGYLDRAGVSSRLHRSLASDAALATWMAGDPVVAARALKEAGPELSAPARERLWRLLHHEEGMRKAVAAAAGELGEDVQNLERTSNTGDVVQLKKDLAVLNPAALKTEQARLYLAEAKAWAGFGEALEKGGWQKLPVFPGLSVFASNGGTWKADSKGEITFVGDDDFMVDLVFASPMAQNVELKAEVEFEMPKTEFLPTDWAFGPMLAWMPDPFGLPASPKAARGLMHHVSDTMSEAVIESRSLNTRPKAEPATVKGINKLSLAMKDGKATLHADDVTVADIDLAQLRIEQKSGLAGFTAYRVPHGGKVRIKNIEARLVP